MTRRSAATARGGPSALFSPNDSTTMPGESGLTAPMLCPLRGGGGGGERRDVREGPRHAEPADLVGLEAVEAAAAEANLSRVGHEKAREQVEHRGLPPPVGPDPD